MTNIKNSSRQRGAALLFALGILSLLLVMGVAFLGNALISQKIAVNSQESASAKLLGQTAIDQVLSHLTLFHLAQVRNAGDFYASDASSVFSRRSTTAFDNNALTIKRDMIYTDNAPLFTINRGKQGNPAKPWYDGSKSLAEWVYVHEDGKFSDGSGTVSSKITGRFAYQVLPQTSSSRLSLYAVTAGASRRAGYNLDSAATARIPQKHRWGVDVDELVPIANTMLAGYWKHDSTELCDPLHEFDNFVNVLSGAKGGSNQLFAVNDENTENRKRFLEHIFTEGRGRVAREAYWGGDGWYPRFNIGRFSYYWDGTKRVAVKTSDDNNWYQRFLDLSTPPADAAAEKVKIDEIKNTERAVDALLKAQTTSGKYTDAFIYDGQYEVSGLPFLRRIGNNGEKGAFETVEYLRRQIAANLNDYCDEDSIPTSDVPASEWKVDGTAPNYTGNENTPYINEIALGLKISDAKFSSAPGKFDLEGKVSAELIAELIKVYKTIVPDSLDTVQLDGKINTLDVTFKVTLDGKADGTYVQADDTQKKIEEFALYGGSSDKGTPAKFSDKEFKVDFKDKLVGTGPYWIKNISIGDDIPFTVELYDMLKSRASNDNIKEDDVKVTFNIKSLDKIKIEVAKIDFRLGNLVLSAEFDDGGSKKRFGIDFVKFIPAPGEGESYALTEGGSGTATEFTLLDDLNRTGILHVGLMQAVDPRQNLNAVFDKANGKGAKTSDWSFSLTPTLSFAAKENWGWDDLTKRITSGLVNECSNSSERKDGTGSGNTVNESDRDAETATDPAYQGDASDKHISTAVIRNAPMMSPWELGFIHRGIPFQTINLLKAGGIGNNLGTADQPELAEDAHAPGNFTSLTSLEGTLYKHGDAGILDQIKMTDLTKSYGKIDFSALETEPANWIAAGISFETLKKELLKSLFENLKTHSPAKFVEQVKNRDKAPSTTDLPESNHSVTCKDEWFSDLLKTSLRSKIFGDNPDFYASFNALTTDAAREEVIGKIINLIEGRGASLPTVFKVVIAAQAIRDLEGSITKLDSSGAPQTKSDAASGKFDATIKSKTGVAGSDEDSSIYYDEILGSCRMLVTIEKLHYFESDEPRARLRVKQIEYLD